VLKFQRYIPCLLTIAGIVLPQAIGYAQQIPQNLTPGALIQQNNQPWALPQETAPENGEPSNFAPSPKAPKVTPEIEVPKKPPNPAVNSELKILVTTIHVEGLTLVPYSQVEPVLAKYRNKELSFADVQNLTTELTQLYVQAGYVNSQVYIPPQRLDNHILILKALEVKVGQVKYQQGHWFGPRAVLPRVGLSPGDYLNIHDLDRSIGLINDNPDVTLKAQIEQGQQSATSDLLISGKDQFPYHLTPFFDNLGRSGIGNQRLGASAVSNNLLGFGDTDYLSGNATNRSYGLTNQYIFPVGPWGTQLEFDYAFNHSQLGGSLEPLNLVSTANIYSPMIRQNLIHTDKTNLSATLGFDIKNLDTDSLGAPLHHDRIRVLRADLNGYRNDPWGRTFLNQELGLGVPLFHATTGDESYVSKAGTGSRFIRFDGGITRYQKLFWGTSGVLQFRYQYSPQRLASVEEFQAGGAFTVRGYSEGMTIGDSGYIANAEWYIPIRLFPAKAQIPFSHDLLNQSTQWVLFSDLGEIVLNHPIIGELTNRVLLSYGTGIRLQLTKLIVLRLDVGFPLTYVGPNSTARIHFGLQSTLF